MKDRLIWSIFLALVAVFLVVAIGIFVPLSVPLDMLFLVNVLLFIVPWALFLLLGVALIVLTVRRKIGGWLRIFLLLSGASAVGMIFGILLHNLMDMWLGVEELVSLTAVIYVGPPAFLVGGVGSIILGIKESFSGSR